MAHCQQSTHEKIHLLNKIWLATGKKPDIHINQYSYTEWCQ